MLRPLASARSRRVLAAGVATTIALTVSACSSATPDTTQAAVDDRGCITDFNEDTDYFPAKSEVEDAENFSISYENSYQVLTVAQPFPGAGAESWVLVQCGAPTPDLTGDLADATVIEIPITSLYAASTTHLPSLVELDRLDVLTGVSNGAYVSNAEVHQAVQDGEVAEFAMDGAIDTEVVVTNAPDVLMTGEMDDPTHPTLRDAGVAVVANAEWLESGLLGRAEWIKVVAALTGDEERAAEVYADIKSRYQGVAAQAQGKEPVDILIGNIHDGTWSMPSGGGYVGQLIRDAGGTYPWIEEQQAGSLPMDFETVFVENGDAEIWFINDTTITTIEGLLAQNEQYGNLTAATDGQVWNANKAIGPGGGNDYWERGVLRPDLILSDLVKILHPDLLPGHELEFYQPLTR